MANTLIVFKSKDKFLIIILYFLSGENTLDNRRSYMPIRNSSYFTVGYIYYNRNRKRNKIQSNI